MQHTVHGNTLVPATYLFLSLSPSANVPAYFFKIVYAIIRLFLVSVLLTSLFLVYFSFHLCLINFSFHLCLIYSSFHFCLIYFSFRFLFISHTQLKLYNGYLQAELLGHVCYLISQKYIPSRHWCYLPLILVLNYNNIRYFRINMCYRCVQSSDCKSNLSVKSFAKLTYQL